MCNFANMKIFNTYKKTTPVYTFTPRYVYEYQYPLICPSYKFNPNYQSYDYTVTISDFNCDFVQTTTQNIS